MARVTVEDCLGNVENRFQLVLLASRRARQIELTSTDIFVDAENDKPTVIALREIAEEKVNKAIIDEIENQQKQPIESEAEQH